MILQKDGKIPAFKYCLLIEKKQTGTLKANICGAQLLSITILDSQSR